MIREWTAALCLGYILDLLLGDPHWLWHPVQGMGWIIEKLETALRKSFPGSRRGELAAGAFLVILVTFFSVSIPFCILALADNISSHLRFAVMCIMSYQLLALKSLNTESRKVYDSLAKGDREGARFAVSMIVGRDTEALDEAGIIQAAVETVAENTSDGVIAPMIFMALLGPLGGFFYKAVNTMDSMVGYKNETFLYFGRAAARLDDAVNFIPARLSAYLMLGAAFLLGLDWKRAYSIYKRDRRNHKSPNSAQTEAVCAGALQIRLAGDAYYFGKLVQKPTIGDAVRPVESEDIRRANQLLHVTAFLCITAIGLLAFAGRR